MKCEDAPYVTFAPEEKIACKYNEQQTAYELPSEEAFNP